MYLPVFTVYLTGHGIGLDMVVFSQAFYSILQFIGEVPTGLIADKFGQRLSVVIGYVIEASGIVVVALFPTAIGLCACYAIGGLASAFLSGSEEALFFENAKSDNIAYGPSFAKYLSNQTVGMVVATAFGGIIFALFGAASAQPLLWGTVVALIFCAAFSLTLRDVQKESKTAESQGTKFWDMLRQGIATIRKDDLLRNMMVVMMLIVPGEYFLYNIYQPIFAQARVPAIWFGLSISLGLALNAVIMQLIPAIERRWTLDKIIAAVGVVIGMGFLVLSWSQTPVIAVLAVVGALGLVEVHRPVISDYLNERIESHQRVTVLSTLSFAQRVATTVLRILLALAVLLGGVRLSGYIQGGYLILGAALSYWLLIRCGCAHRVTPHGTTPPAASIIG